MTRRTWIALAALAAFLALVLTVKSCADLNRTHTAESWIRDFVTARQGPTLKRDVFFNRLSRFDPPEAARALVNAIDSEEEAYADKRYALIMALARLGEPSALEGLLELYPRLGPLDRGRLAFAIGASLTRENLETLLAACEENEALLDALPGLTGEEQRPLDQWSDYFADDAALEAVREYCQAHAARAVGSR